MIIMTPFILFVTFKFCMKGSFGRRDRHHLIIDQAL